MSLLVGWFVSGWVTSHGSEMGNLLQAGGSCCAVFRDGTRVHRFAVQAGTRCSIRSLTKLEKSWPLASKMGAHEHVVVWDMEMLLQAPEAKLNGFSASRMIPASSRHKVELHCV